MIIECGPLHDRRTLTITLPEVKKVGVFVSGGIDSALLYYLLVLKNQKTDNQHNIRPIVIHRKEGSKYHARPVVDQINTVLKISSVPVRLGNTTLSELEQVKHAVIQAFALPPYFEAVYMGVITNRPEHTIGFDPVIVEHHEQVFMPFKDLEKCHIIDIYYQLGISDLLKHTHSCDQHETIPCGTCNGCRERIWGFNQLNQVDPLNT